MPLSDKTRQGIAFGSPIPGQSLTTPPKSAPYEHPPQFTKIEDAMNYLMAQLTDQQFMPQLLQMMEAKMPIEAITRTLLFTGFASGKWTVDLAVLMYKPLMLALIAIAHRAGVKDTPVIMPQAVTQKKLADLKNYMVSQEFGMHNSLKEIGAPTLAPQPPQPQGQGFMARPGGNT
jgi:hypothetical protein